MPTRTCLFSQRRLWQAAWLGVALISVFSTTAAEAQLLPVAPLSHLTPSQSANNSTEPVYVPKEAAPPLQTRENFLKQLEALGENHAQREILSREWLMKNPTDEEVRFELARVLSWQGKFEDSLALYGQLRAKSPENVDYIVGNAQVLLWAKRPEEARITAAQALKANPEYEEAYRTKLQAEFDLGRYKEAKLTLAEGKRLFPNETWEMPKVEQQAVRLGDYPVEVETSFSFDGLSKNFNGWNGQYLSIKKPFSKRAGVYASTQRTSRFDIQDFNMTAGSYFPISKKWGGAVEASLSPTGDVLPQWTVYGEINRILPWGFVAHAGFRHSEYANATTELGTYTLENYWKRWHIAYTLYNNYLHNGGWSNSHVGQIDFTYGKHENTIGLIGALGQELENIGPPRGVISTDVMALWLTGIQWLHPRWGITYALGVQKQGDIYTRRGLQFGLRYLF